MCFLANRVRFDKWFVPILTIIQRESSKRPSSGAASTLMDYYGYKAIDNNIAKQKEEQTNISGFENDPMQAFVASL